MNLLPGKSGEWTCCSSRNMRRHFSTAPRRVSSSMMADAHPDSSCGDPQTKKCFMSSLAMKEKSVQGVSAKRATNSEELLRMWGYLANGVLRICATHTLTPALGMCDAQFKSRHSTEPGSLCAFTLSLRHADQVAPTHLRDFKMQLSRSPSAPMDLSATFATVRTRAERYLLSHMSGCTSL